MLYQRHYESEFITPSHDVTEISGIYQWAPWKVALFILIIDYGIVNLLMLAEGRFWRDRYISFAFGDLVLLPLVAGLAAWVLQHNRFSGGWYTARWWHLAVLAAGFLLSIGMEAISQFNWRQEISPSKLWHTFIFGLVFYLLVIAAVPMLVILFGGAGIASKAVVVLALALASWHVTLGLLVDAKAPMTDQHLEAHYRFPDVWNTKFTVRQ